MNWFNKRFLPADKLAVCFSDPAGANACLALAEMRKMDHHSVPMLFSNKNYNTIDPELDVNISDAVPDWRELDRKIIVTGTSHPESSGKFEVRCIASAKHQQLHVISFVDHWINFALRFEGLREAEYPDEIWVVDENAKKLALEEGLPEHKLVVSGNPYHTYLKNYWRPHYKNKEYLNKVGIDIDRKHLLFAPDPLSLRLGKAGTGFTEMEALETLLDIIPSLPEPPVLLIKLHPLQPMEAIKRILESHKGRDVILLDKVDIPELIHSVDVVIGFYSNILLDAIAIGKEVIRYFPGNRDADLLRHATIRATFASTCPELKESIKRVL
jgi:hypothetical protein